MSKDPVLALLPSPLLGPAVWAPVAGELRLRGWDVLVPPAYDAVTGPGDVLTHLLAHLPEDEPLALVPHSNAGLYAAALAAVRDVRGVVFVDAGLPSSGPTTPTAPPSFGAFVATLVEADGLLPPWTRWWAADEVDGLFPDPAARAAVEAEQKRLPPAYFEAVVPSPAAGGAPSAYLAFGETYAAERAVAAARGWPVATLPGAHLHTLVDPVGVAGALEGLLGSLGLMSPR